jgi:hypothetical protein
VLISSIALLGAYVAPWLQQIPMPEATPFFKDSLEEPSSRLLMLVGCATLASYGLLKKLRDDRKTSSQPASYSAPARRAA